MAKDKKNEAGFIFFWTRPVKNTWATGENISQGIDLIQAGEITL